MRPTSIDIDVYTGRQAKLAYVASAEPGSEHNSNGPLSHSVAELEESDSCLDLESSSRYSNAVRPTSIHVDTGRQAKLAYVASAEPGSEHNLVVHQARFSNPRRACARVTVRVCTCVSVCLSVCLLPRFFPHRATRRLKSDMYGFIATQALF